MADLLSTQLQDFAIATQAAIAWTPAMNVTLGNLLVGRVPVPKRTDAFDSVFRMRPTGWTIAMQEIKDANNTRKAVCSLDLRVDGNLKFSVYPTVAVPTLLVGLICAVALAWAYDLNQVGK